MPNLNLNYLDPGIRRTVAWLREHGFETTDSGDGRTKAELIAKGYALGVPHVVMVVDPDKLVLRADVLRSLLGGHGVEVDPIGRGGVSIQASYDPGDSSAVIVLTGVDDALLFGEGK